MIKLNSPEPNKKYSTRISSYVISFNDEGKIPIVHHENWGLILPGGKIDDDESPEEAIKRETIEEIGYEIIGLEFYEEIEDHYDIHAYGELHHTHALASFYTGKITNKIAEPIEIDVTLEWHTLEEIQGKMKLEFQNVILKKLLDEQ